MKAKYYRDADIDQITDNRLKITDNRLQITDSAKRVTFLGVILSRIIRTKRKASITYANTPRVVNIKSFGAFASEASNHVFAGTILARIVHALIFIYNRKNVYFKI